MVAAIICHIVAKDKFLARRAAGGGGTGYNYVTNQVRTVHNPIPSERVSLARVAGTGF